MADETAHGMPLALRGTVPETLTMPEQHWVLWCGRDDEAKVQLMHCKCIDLHQLAAILRGLAEQLDTEQELYDLMHTDDGEDHP